MEHKIGWRIIIREENSRIQINLKPSKNILIGGFQIIMTLAFGYLCYSIIRDLVNSKMDIYTGTNLIFFLFVILTLIGTINRLASFYDVFCSEEEIEIINEIVTIKKSKLLRNRIIKINLSEIQNLEIEGNYSEIDNIRIDFVKWTNFILLKGKQKIRFFEMTNYDDLEKLRSFLNNKKLSN